MKQLETKLAAELRRGVLQIAVLALLRKQAYGYQLLKELSAAGLETEEGTLYPILRRLEQQELVASTWSTEGARPRKYYKITSRGLETLDSFLGTWHQIHAALEKLVGQGADEDG